VHSRVRSLASRLCEYVEREFQAPRCCQRTTTGYSACPMRLQCSDTDLDARMPTGAGHPHFDGPTAAVYPSQLVVWLVASRRPPRQSILRVYGVG
jgi:hypothetical protein